MKVAAYLRKSPAGISVPEQYADLERAAHARGWVIYWCSVDQGEQKAGLRSNCCFQSLFEALIDSFSETPFKAFMFWSAGHVAGSLEGFLEFVTTCSDIDLVWYVHNPRMDSIEDQSKLLNSLCKRLLNIHTEISGYKMANRSALMKTRGTNPGRQKTSPRTEQKIVHMKKNGYTIRDIQKKLNVSNSVVMRVIKENSL